MTFEDKLLYLFLYAHGPVSDSCSLEVVHDDNCNPIGVDVMKHGVSCWSASREELLFDYVTMLFTEESTPV